MCSYLNREKTTMNQCVEDTLGICWLFDVLVSDHAIKTNKVDRQGLRQSLCPVDR